MADISKSISITLDDAHEGGFQNNPNDRANWSGGMVGLGVLVGTKFGITALDMPGADIRNLTAAQAMSWYETTTKPQRYNNALYSQINAQCICDKLFDMGVLFGIVTAVERFQMALDLNVDGSFGPLTLAAANRVSASMLLLSFKSEMHAHAATVAAKNPNEASFLPDWSKRIDS